jgi:hypothetical protein
MPEMQTVPARHGVATFVPAGQTIKIVNTSGSQVIDTWAFALPHPDVKNGDEQQEGQQEAPKKEELPEAKEEEKPVKPAAKKNKKNSMDLPSQEDAESKARRRTPGALTYPLLDGVARMARNKANRRRARLARPRRQRTRRLGARTCQAARDSATMSRRLQAILYLHLQALYVVLGF